ncbi:related to HAC1 BZIP transcription factor, regulates the unfolded-protein response [Rhynchosporium secalis]|uniref:Related to HAC1 BZIP transcription factor, regulates the unfolded-protein response n=1 Tax=Rhynchosporium secalis TaxID=38038 RepID=A0A1E1LUU0_RHYSE|nr:related to HAC1 BZIP transcription factor, regulates the unfolded-protein response [Rhynchosporium secalis]
MSDSPHIKFENSPVESLADSFVSTPNNPYPSLFASDTMDPSEVMTPQSFDDDSMFGDMQEGSMAGTPAPDKKPVKKRKSWGQQLPEPKTNLPPRKRAKTEDEKEQRRVERVLRNRRAAQSSRERKRQEVEALEAQKQAVEQTNQDLLRRLHDAEAKNVILERQLQQMSGGMNVFPSSSVASSPGGSEQLRQTPRPSITFSQNLFGPLDADPQPIDTQSLIDSSVTQTVNPASLSPEIGPVVDSNTNASSSDLTQHPAAMFNQSHDQYEYESYLDLPSTSASDLELLNNRVLPATNQFDHFFDNLAHNNDGVFEDSHFDEFLNQDDQPATEIQSSDSLAEKTASLQSPFGASTYGCDDGYASRLEARDSASVETLMTLLWAIRVIAREVKLEAPKPDAAAVARKCPEVDNLFRSGEQKGASLVSRTGNMNVGGHKKKSLDHWRTAFQHDRS